MARTYSSHSLYRRSLGRGTLERFSEALRISSRLFDASFLSEAVLGGIHLTDWSRYRFF
jgi:hypothetical protein